jgi:cyclomaltodextrinase
VRRRHIWGGHCDGLMNYPFRDSLLAYLLGGDAACFMERMETLRENYPPFAFYSAMNFLGTHDTPRILTLLGVGSPCGEYTKAWRADFRMSEEQRARGAALLKLAAVVLFAFPGSPTIYYGDEAGMEGFEDPFNRQTFPWGREDRELTAWFAALGRARSTLPPLRGGDIRYLAARDRVLAFSRTLAGEQVIAAVNAGERAGWVKLPGPARDLLSGAAFSGPVAVLPPMTGMLLTVENREE